MRRLCGRNALVTGGASGLGKAIALRFASEGATVIISDVDANLGERVAHESGFTFMQHDVRNDARWEEVVRDIEVRHGALHVLVNNAGIVGTAGASTPENMSLSDWRQVFAVNVEGVFLGCRSTIASMRRTGGGAIVNVSSITSMLATPAGAAYGASKAAVRHLTRSVAQHCAQEGLNIRCNCVIPGTVWTPIWEEEVRANARERGLSFEQVVANMEARTPLGKFASPNDVAATVAFLVSEDAEHITGADFVVDGGYLGCNTFAPRSTSKQQATGASEV